MPYKPGLGQGHNQKKDTHPLDFDVTLGEQNTRPEDTAATLIYRLIGYRSLR